MKIHSVILVVGVLAAAIPAVAQQGAKMPAACRPDKTGEVNQRACADALPVGSPERALPLINLGAEAFLNRNFGEAVRLYDEAIPPGKTIVSDVRFHAFRAGAYSHVGRDAEAYRDARLALDMLNGKSVEPGVIPAARPVSAGEIYATILPILKKNRDAGFPAALAAYTAIPSNSWIDWANRAGVLDELGEGKAAADASAHALALNPTHPAVLNNHCYILANGGKAAEALPYCQKAIAAAPNEPSIHHSYATALALAGKCKDAVAELAVARRLDPSSATYKKPIACKAS